MTGLMTRATSSSRSLTSSKVFMPCEICRKKPLLPVLAPGVGEVAVGGGIHHAVKEFLSCSDILRAIKPLGIRPIAFTP